MLKNTGTMKSTLTSTPNLKNSESIHANIVYSKSQQKRKVDDSVINNDDAYSNLSAISSAQTSTSSNCNNEDIIDSLTPHFILYRNNDFINNSN